MYIHTRAYIMYIRTYVRMYVRTYICMYVCMYVQSNPFIKESFYKE